VIKLGSIHLRDEQQKAPLLLEQGRQMKPARHAVCRDVLNLLSQEGHLAVTGRFGMTP
jgi:hypothetical protein